MTLDWKGEKYIRAVEKGTMLGLTKAAIVVQSQAKLNAPVDTGNLRGSIDYEVEKTQATVGTNVHYASHIEYGTRYMDSQSFLRSSLDSNKDNIRKLLKNSIADAIKGG